jgi:hypothetical protein
MRVFDDIFDTRFLIDLRARLSHSSWTPTNIANRHTWPYGESGSHKLLGSVFFHRKNINLIHYKQNDLDLSHTLIDCFYPIIQRAERHLFLQEISANLQFCGMDGTNHRDGGGLSGNVYSYILMLGDDVDENCGGEFVNDSTNEIVPYKFGRVIEIHRDEVHRGLSFNVSDKVRYSLKFVGNDDFNFA